MTKPDRAARVGLKTALNCPSHTGACGKCISSTLRAEHRAVVRLVRQLNRWKIEHTRNATGGCFFSQTIEDDGIFIRADALLAALKRRMR